MMTYWFKFFIFCVCLMGWGIGWGQCEATFSFTGGVGCSQTFTFTADNAATNNPNATYEWILGSPTTIQFGTQVTHTFTSLGGGTANFQVELKVSVPQGCFNSTIQTVTVQQVPDASFDDDNIFSSFAVCQGNEATLVINNESTTQATNSWYEIDWGNGPPIYSAETFPDGLSRDYVGQGEYFITLTITGENGCTASASETFFLGGNPGISVTLPPLPTNMCAPEKITFFIEGVENNTPGTVYDVFFSDSPNPDVPDMVFTHPPPESFCHIFNTSSCGKTSQGGFNDAFEAKVTAHNSCGEASATVEPIRISTKPTAKIDTFCIKSTCPGEEVSICEDILNANFYVTSQGSCVEGAEIEWEITPPMGWELVNGSTLTDECLDVVFDDVGTYEVRLIASNPCGTTHAVKEITVQPIPTADFEPQPVGTSGCAPLEVIFQNNSVFQNANIWSISDEGWTFAAGSHENSENPVVIFTKAGTYDIELTAINGCQSDVHVETIVVSDIPTLSFPDTIPDFCMMAEITPTLTFLDNNSAISSTFWEFLGGEPEFSNELVPGNIIYDQTGEFTVSVTMENGCGSSTISDVFEIFAPPIVDAGLDMAVCKDEESFLPMDASPANGIWYLNGNMIDSFDPMQQGEGNFTLIYEVVSAQDCAGSDDMMITVNALPEIQITPLPEVICSNAGSLDLEATPPDGTWRVNGITIADAFFHPNDYSGVVEICYEYQHPDTECSNSECITIEVASTKEINIPDFDVVCNIEDCIDLEAKFEWPEDNCQIIWSGEAIKDQELGLFSISQAGLVIGDITEVFYTVITDQDCETEGSVMIEIVPFVEADVGNDITICLSAETFQPQANLEGEWISAGGGIIEVVGNDAFINLQATIDAGCNPCEFTLTAFEGESCETSDSFILTIIDLTNVDGGSDQFVCEDGTSITLVPVVTPENSMGAWSGSCIDSDGQVIIECLDVGCHEMIYTVESTILSGCTASDVVMICVEADAVAAFTFPDLICEGDEVTFENLSSGGSPLSYFWEFECGTSMAENAVCTFPNAGDYEVCLTVSTSNPNDGTVLCDSTFCEIINVVPAPVIDFTVEPTSGCGPLTITVTNNSTPLDADFVFCLDGETIEVTENPFQIILEPEKEVKTYTLTLKAANGCAEIEASQEITVDPVPIANWESDLDEYCNGQKVIIENILCGNPTSIKWLVDNDSVSMEEDPCFVFEDANTEIVEHEICLVVKNDCGEDALCKTVVIRPDSVGGIFNIPKDTFCVNELIPFTNIQTAGTSILYDFGDLYNIETTTTGESNPTFFYTQSGTFIVTLKIFGCGFFEYRDTITIIDIPTPDFTFPSPVCVGEVVNFDNESIHADSYCWDFGDGSPTDNFNNPGHPFETAGIYTITLLAKNQEGCTAEISYEIEVVAPPNSSFQIDTTACEHEVLMFENLTEGDNLSYHWDFGNDSTATVKNPTHSYKEAGNYRVILTVTNIHGCASQDTIFIDVLKTPDISVEVELDDPCENSNALVFSNILYANEFEWQLDDSEPTFENVANPVFENLQAAEYILSVSASNDHCVATETIEFEVVESPQIIPELKHLSCFELIDGGITLSFTGGEPPYFSGIILPDGTPVIGTQFEHLTAGIYTLFVKDANGCEASEVVEINRPAPISVEIFARDSTPILSGDSVRLGLNIKAPNPSFQWSPAATLSCDDCPNPTAQPCITTTYTVVLTDENGCTATDEIEIEANTSRVLFVPTSFTPNGDGINDIMTIRSGNPNISGIKEFKVYDRWGATVFEAYDFQPNVPDFGWDGRVRGHVVKSDVYTWYAIVEMKCEEDLVLSGDVLLLL